MSHITIPIPTETNIGLTSVSLGMIRAMERKNVRLSVLKPIAQPRAGDDAFDQTTTIVRVNSFITTAVEPLKMSYVEGLLSSNQKGILTGGIIVNYHANTKDAEIVPVEGLVPTRKHQFVQSLNYEIVKTLSAEIVFVISQGTDTPEQLREHIELTHNSFGGVKDTNITSVIVNKLNVPADEQGYTRPDLSEISDDSTEAKVNNVDLAKLQKSNPPPILGAVSQSFDLIAARTIDMARYSNTTIINEGNINTRRAKSVAFCARNIPRMLEHFRTGSLLVTSADHPDVLAATCLTATNGVEIGALLLTGDYEMDVRISKLCERVFAAGLSVFMVNTNTWQTSLSLQNFDLGVPTDDHERVERVQEYVANYINADWIGSPAATSEHSRRLFPSAFHYQLTGLVHKAGKRIILPKGDEPRTIKTAVICAECGTMTYVLLGNPAEINRVAASWGVELGAGTEIVDPEVIRENYAGRLVELRKNRGMTKTAARGQLEDNIAFGTLMLEQDEADSLVSNVVRTTANTIRPPLQLIKTVPGSSLVSSVFFMLLPEQAYVCSDCATNPDPTTEQLAEITAQSAGSAAAFSIEPYVAMLSYSAGIPGAGNGVGKVREATRLAQERRPDLMINGPLQYDTAVVADVAGSGAPDSPIADRATVFILPDLSTDNTAYKAVRRSAGPISIGPMLQGMRKPVSDLSRGALVDDIICIIALTAIQSIQQQ